MLLLPILILTVHISIEYDAIDRDLAMRIVEIAEQALPEISDFIGYDYQRDIHIVLISDEEEFHRLTEKGFPDWGVGFADAKRSLILICSPRAVKIDLDIKSIVKHELAHIVLGGAAGGGWIPRWFNEGVAMYCSQEWRFGREKTLAIANLTNSLLPLTYIEDRFPRDRNRAELAYTQSFSAISYIIENFGREGLRDIFRNLKRDGFDKAFFSSIGISHTQFKEDWKDWAKKNYSFGYFLFSNSLLWGLVVVLFLIVGSLSLISRRNKLKRWREERNW